MRSFTSCCFDIDTETGRLCFLFCSSRLRSVVQNTRRAMIKSYQTSGGTVLSTNWKEVAEKDYEKDRVAPKGQEFVPRDR